jgi:16S rRNA (guanine966-N2)-methyltransferase
MSMRITGGSARGRLLKEPVGQGVRPTSARVREALFSVIGQDLSGQSVLDAFGGAGLVGLEAWSRGALVTVVEKDRAALAALRARGQDLRATWEVVGGDVLELGPRWEGFDGVFCDPPYAMAPGPVIERLGPLARRWFVYEARAGVALPASVGPLRLDRPRAYGDTTLWVYRALSAPTAGDLST